MSTSVFKCFLFCFYRFAVVGHQGVSCDGCMAPNFSGDRYKCLRCYDFDLCARCYAEERAEGRKDRRNLRDSNDEHQPTHPMQCIMTQQDFAMRNYRRIRVPACPICISTDFYRVGFGDYMPNQLTDMVAHMQEHHMQTQPSAAASNSSHGGRGGLSEFLRDRDLRRVTMHSVPLIANDSDFDEPEGEGTRRNPPRGSTSQRSDAFPRIRRRLVERSANDAQGTEEESSGQPPFGFRPLSSLRQRTTPAQQNGVAMQSGVAETVAAQGAEATRMRFVRSANAVGDGSRSSTLSSTPHTSGSRTSLGSQRNARSNPSAGSVTFPRAFHSPITTFSRPNVPRSQPTSNGISASRAVSVHSPSRQVPPNVRGSTTNNDRNSAASDRLADEVARSLLSASEQTMQRGDGNQSHAEMRNLIRYDREQLEMHEPQARGSGTRRTSVEPTVLCASPASTLPVSSSAQPNGGNENVQANSTDPQQYPVNVVPTDGIVMNNVGRAVLILPLPHADANDESATVTVENAQTTETQNSKANVAPADSCGVEAKRNVHAVAKSSKASHVHAIWPVLTAGAPVHTLPVVRIRYRKQQQQQSANIKITEKQQALKAKTQTTGMAEAEEDIPPLRLVIRVGRPLQSAFAQRRAKVASATKASNGDDWWSRHSSQPFDPNFLLRYSRRHRIHDDRDLAENVPSGMVAPERLSARREEVTMVPVSRAIEVIRRLDARNAQSHRPSPTETSPNPGAVDYMTLIRRSEAALHSVVAASASSARQGSKQTSSTNRSDQRARGSVRSRSKVRDARDEDLNDYFTNAFKPPDVEVLLDGVVVERKRLFKPFNVRTEEDRERVLMPWLRKERELDELASLSLRSSSINRELLAPAAKASAEERVSAGSTASVGKMSTPIDDEEPIVWESEGESSSEASTEKSEGALFDYSPSLCVVVGPIHGMLSAQDDGENNYWSDYRYLHNRRDVFLLKNTLRSVDVPPENAFDPCDWRFPRQLVLGALDAPISIFLRSHYLPGMFERALRTNLRELLLMKHPKRADETNDEKSAAEPSSKNVLGTDNEWKEVHQWGQSGAEDGVNGGRAIDVHPDLWYFLDLAGFVEFSA
ncbi:unnamed protein product [Toxocara canis]|uniref:RING-type E3 ubiquitin transferase n=1 Tax=Toxocara canis TaxID=6265 RepID=A0A183V0S4_TOXCA|nr:unnamed protein product [Toxocara canis]